MLLVGLLHAPSVEGMRRIFEVPGDGVMGDESIREEDGSDDEEKDEDIKGGICQLLDQGTASQRRDKSCAPSH